MAALEETPLETNALGGLPWLGVLFAAPGLAAGILLTTSPPGADGDHRALYAATIVLPMLILGGLPMLWVARVRAWPGAGRLEIQRGLRPFAKPRRSSIAEWKEARVACYRSKSGVGFNVFLIPFAGRRATLALWASRARTEQALAFAERLGLPATLDAESARLAPAWLQSRVPRSSA